MVEKKIYSAEGKEIHGIPNLEADTNVERLQDILKIGLTNVQKQVSQGVPERSTVDFLKVLLSINEHLASLNKEDSKTVNINVKHQDLSTEELVALAQELTDSIN